MRVRAEKSENKWRRGGGRRPVRGEARCKGGGNRGDDADWRRSGRTIPCQDLRRCRQPRKREVCWGSRAGEAGTTSASGFAEEAAVLR